MNTFKKKTLVVVSALMIASAVVVPLSQHNGFSFGEEVGASKAISIANTTMQTSANLNMRTTASTKGKVLLTIPKGTKVTTNSKVGSWYKVSYKGKTGFVSGSYLKTVKATATKAKVTAKPAPKPVAKPAPKATTTTTTYTTTAGLNLRTGASTKHKVLLTIPKGKAVTFVSKSGSWSKVKYGSKTGFVSTKYLKVTKVAVKPVVKPTPKPAVKPVVKPTPKPTPKPVVTPKPVPKASVSWMTKKDATAILGKVLDKGNNLIAYDKYLVSVGFFNNTDAKGEIHVDSTGYISATYINPGDFGKATYDEEKAWLSKMDKAILAFSETQVGAGTSASKQMASDFKSFIINSKRDAKVLKTYNGKTYELWNMSGTMKMSFKK